MIDGCEIESYPDVAGIGVRVAIYVQSLLCFIPAVGALWDRHVSLEELARVKHQSSATLIIAFSILISSIVQALTLGLTNYHTSIVLSLSWMNNTNAFVYFLLYVQFKSQILERQGIPGVGPTVTAWISHVKTVWARKFAQKQLMELEQRTFAERGWEFIKAENVLILGSIHLTLMAALGIWLWIDPRSFGQGESCAYDVASLGILGSPVRFAADQLRIWSLVIYFFFLIPGVNLVIPGVVFLYPFLVFQAWRYKILSRHSCRKQPQKMRDFLQRALHYPSTIPIFVGLFLLFVINAVFIIDIELALRWNHKLQDDNGESQWNFGQTLALILLVMPLRDLKLFDWILSLWYFGRERDRKDELGRKLQEEIQKSMVSENSMKIVELVLRGADPNLPSEDNVTCLEACTMHCKFQGVPLLLERGANPDIPFSGNGSTILHEAIVEGNVDLVLVLLVRGVDVTIRGGKYETALQAASLQGGNYGAALGAASCHGHLEIVQKLLAANAHPNIQGGDYGTALGAASCHGHLEIVQKLLAANANPNIQGGDYWTALGAASFCSHLEIVEALLGANADPNIRGGHYGTALSVASSRGYLEIVEALLGANADPNIQGGHYGTALGAASQRGHLEIVQTLLGANADPNMPGGDYGTALGAASVCGYLEIVEALLGANADPNIQGGSCGTALVAVSEGGHLEIVEALLGANADPNIQGGYYGTALGAASSNGYLEIVQALLGAHADPNIQDGNHETALVVASSRGYLEIVQKLLAANANPNIQGGKYGTALGAASANGDVEIVRALLLAGADPNIQGGEHGTALQIALSFNSWYHGEIVKLLSV